MTERNIITAYMNRRHQVIRKIRSVRPNQAAERAQGYLANQHITNPNNPQEYAVYAEVYEADTTIQHAALKFFPGSGRVIVDYRRDPRQFETRYAISPLFEEK
jgi:hypothetical protein